MKCNNCGFEGNTRNLCMNCGKKLKNNNKLIILSVTQIILYFLVIYMFKAFVKQPMWIVVLSMGGIFILIPILIGMFAPLLFIFEELNIKRFLAIPLGIFLIVLAIFLSNEKTSSEYDMIQNYINNSYSANYTILNKGRHWNEAGTNDFYIVGIFDNDKDFPFIVTYDKSNKEFSDDYTDLKRGQELLDDNYISSLFGRHVALMRQNLEYDSSSITMVLDINDDTNFNDISEKLKNVYGHYKEKVDTNLNISIYFSNDISDTKNTKLFLVTCYNYDLSKKYNNGIIEDEGGYYLVASVYESNLPTLEHSMKDIVKYVKKKRY